MHIINVIPNQLYKNQKSTEARIYLTLTQAQHVDKSNFVSLGFIYYNELTCYKT